jgi:signal transduction histidine kinase
VPAIAYKLGLVPRVRPEDAAHWRPRWTLRLRLTLLYGALFLLAGTILLAITYGLARSTGISGGGVIVQSKAIPGEGVNGLYITRSKAVPAPSNFPAGTLSVPAPLRAAATRLQYEAQAQVKAAHSDQLDALLTESGIALGIMAIASIGLGWVMAGRALRPLRTMSSRARGISERNLHERLALEGPNDELRELGDTFDGLLGRLERAFESQRQFVANASHELRTPITVSRALVEVALADPEASMASMRDTMKRVLAAGEEQERLISALLTLARSQRGLAVREEVELSVIVGDVLEGVVADGIRVQSALREAPTLGDEALVERMVANLVGNALRYNLPSGGWISVWTGIRNDRPALGVSNGGPVVPASEVGALTEPFWRLNGGGRNGAAAGVVLGPGSGEGGLGLGLSIVAAIATAHGADLLVTPRAGGGLDVTVSFPKL